MTGVVEMYDSATALSCPPATDTGDYVNSLRDNSGLLIKSIDHLIYKFFKVSVVKEIVDPFTGDWGALSRAAHGWDHMAAALNATADNHASGAAQLSSCWSGEAATRATHRWGNVAELNRRQATGAAMLATQLRHIVDVAKATGELVAMGLQVLNELAMHAAAMAATAGASAVISSFQMPALVVRGAYLINQIMQAIQKMLKIIELVSKVVEVVKKMMTIAATGSDVAGGLLMGEAAEKQFSG